MWDSLILMVMALVVFGPRRLPQIGRQIGKLMYEFRKASNDFKFQMDEELRTAEEADRRKKEEERLRALALAAPGQPVATPETPVPDGQFPTPPPYPSPYPGEVVYPPVIEPAALAETMASAENAHAQLQVQPPSTGEQVPATPPGSLATQIEVPFPPTQEPNHTAAEDAWAEFRGEAKATAELGAVPVEKKKRRKRTPKEPVNTNG